LLRDRRNPGQIPLVRRRVREGLPRELFHLAEIVVCQCFVDSVLVGRPGTFGHRLIMPLIVWWSIGPEVCSWKIFHAFPTRLNANVMRLSRERSSWPSAETAVYVSVA